MVIPVNRSRVCVTTGAFLRKISFMARESFNGDDMIDYIEEFL